MEKNGRKKMSGLRSGFTTGTCAAAAAKAAAMLLCGQPEPTEVEVLLPAGNRVSIPILRLRRTEDGIESAVRKDAGDASDVTNGIEICCKIRKTPQKGIHIQGGCGVGRVTKPGLSVPVGEWAINPVPRQMIAREVNALLPPDVGVVVEIFVPAGEQIAKKTFNPRLGIKGGISILGTTGIVEPKSEKAYTDSLSLELNVARAAGHKTIFLASGYIGEKLLKERFKIDEEAIIKIGDHVGFMLHECVEKVEEEIPTVILIGHIGKLVKVAAGLFNTHYRFGDARLETIAAYAASCGASPEIINQILELELSEAAIEILRENNLMSAFDKIAQRVVRRADEYCKGRLRLAVILLSLKGEILGTEPKDLIKEEVWEKFTLLAADQGRQTI